MKDMLVDHIAAHLSPSVSIEATSKDTVCAFSGAPLVAGTDATRLKAIIKPATADLADTFKYQSEFVSVNVAKCFTENRLLRGNLYISENGIIAPMVSLKSAREKGRPTWCDVFFDMLEPPCILILTDESKRRLWPNARVTTSGTWLQIFLNEGDICYNLYVDKEKTLGAMKTVIACLKHGFTKQAIRTSLYSQSKKIIETGLERTRALEVRCATFRGTPEFRIATFIGTYE